MIRVEYNNEKKFPVEKNRVEKIVRLASQVEKRIKGSIEVNIVGKSEIKKLNKEFRGKNKETDVLSFSLSGDKWVGDLIGQIFICYPKIETQSKDFNVTKKEEFARMLVHGLLHVVGYDHILEKDAEKMFTIQENIIKKAKTAKIA